ncbi:signal peptidase I [Calothrix brevissima NIES-22]|nr:signal peptidase I [Calothrix brevissima NIES-22]
MRKIGLIFITALSISAINYHAIAQISANKPQNPLLDGSNSRVLNAAFEMRWIPSGSMEPTLHGTPDQWEADIVLIDKLIYNSQSPKRGDIIVFSPTDELKKQQYIDPFISRIVALPGEKVELKKNRVYINNKPLPENYLRPQEETNISVCTTEARPNLSQPKIVPRNAYLTLGDNRSSSYDGRCWGFVPNKNIIGQAVRRVWPLNYQNNLDKFRNQQQLQSEEVFLKNVGFFARPNEENLTANIKFFIDYLAQSRQKKDILGEITALRHISLYYLYSLKFSPQNQQAINYSQDFLDTARKYKIYGAETQALANLGLVYLLQGDSQSAINYAQQVMALTAKNQDYSSEYIALLNQAIAHAYLNDCAKFNMFYNQSLAVAKNFNGARQELIASNLSPALEKIKLEHCTATSMQ